MPRKLLQVPVVKATLAAQTEVPVSGMSDTTAVASTPNPRSVQRREFAGEGVLGSLLSAATR